MLEKKTKNKTLKKCLILLFLALIFSVVLFIMYKYHVEGEKNIPFSITKLITISSAETEDLEQNDGLYQANIVQNNDIFIAIEKNKNYSKEDSIKSITFNNFNIIKQGSVGKIKIYRTSEEQKKYKYSENYEMKDSIEYLGDLNTNLKMEKMTIANQGGLLEFSIILDELGKITYEDNENITSDGTLLNRLNLSHEDIKTSISFDMIIKLNSGNTFKTTIYLELPCGNILEDGVCTTENYSLDKLVYKRVTND